METPKLRLPMTLVGSSLAVIEQDSDDEIAQCVRVICSFPQGTREDLLEFGIGSYELRQLHKIEATEIAAQVRRWEPRAEVDATGRIGTLPREFIVDLLTRRRA